MNDKERSAKMENCEKVLDILNEYIDGELNESDALFVRAHLDSCEACRKAYIELLEIEKLFENTAEEAPKELCENIMIKIKAEKALPSRRRRLTKIFGTAAVAAAISLTVLASPAILMIARGGAAANDMAAEGMFPSKSEKDDYYSADAESPECEFIETPTENGKSETYKEIMDAIDSTVSGIEDKISDVTVAQGKKYTAHFADGSKVSLILTQDIAILDAKEYEYEVSGSRYILTGNNETLIFKKQSTDGGEIYFTEETNG